MSRLTKEYIEKLKHIREVTPDNDPWEARVVSQLLGEIDTLGAENARLREALNQCGQHCLCTRNTPGFDYGEVHKKLGKPKIGARWLTPNDIIVVATKLSPAGENEELQKKNKEELAKVEADKLIYGQGSYLQNLDGSITHIPVGEKKED
jgi:hypothetical protein